MAATYKTVLTLDSSQHDQALSKSANQIYQYKRKADDTDKSIAGLAGKFKKFVGVLSIAKVAGDGFQSMMKNNQDLADKYGVAMERAKGVSDSFFYSISKADFSNLITGMLQASKAAGDLYKAMDELNTLQIGLTGENARLNKELEDARLRYRSGDKSAAADIQRIGNAMVANMQREHDATKNALEQMIKANSNGSGSTGSLFKKGYNAEFTSGFDIEQVHHWISNTKEFKNAVSKAKSEYEQLQKKASEYNSDNIIWYDVAKAESYYKGLQKLYDTMSDGDNAKKFEQLYADMYSKEADLARQQRRNLQYLKEEGADKETELPKVAKPSNIEVEVEPVLPDGSIAKLESELSAKKIEYKMAVSDEDRQRILKEIEGMQEQLDALEGKVKVIPDPDSLTSLRQQLSDIRQQWENSGDSEFRLKLEVDMAELEKQIEEKSKTAAQKAQEAADEAAEKISAAIERVKQKYEEMGNVVTSVNSIMGNAISAYARVAEATYNMNEEHLTEEQKLQHKRSQAYLTATVQIIEAVNTMIPKILSLIAAEEGESMASGLAGAAKVEPWPAKVAAIASIVAQVISVIGTISSITASARYANGGIVGGGSYVGDYNVARVNAGEMILNGTQQARLFRLINNPTINANLPEGGNVVFTIHGSDLQGTLNNYNNRINRIR